MRPPMPPLAVEARIRLLEDILARWKDQIGADYPGYRNHVYRMVHFCLALRDCTDDERDKIVVAGCFHDLGIWSDRTADYLPPSIALATAYLAQHGLEHWSPEITAMIALHHKVTRAQEDRYPLVDVFRTGDLVDVSLGFVTGGVPKAHIKRVKQQFPKAGFHLRLVRLVGQWFAEHPTSPPPFLSGEVHEPVHPRDPLHNRHHGPHRCH
jgi:hypothetical protein